MARIPSQRRIIREDLSEAPGWIEKLLTPLNSFMEAIYSALNKNLTFTENIRSQIAFLEFETAPSYVASNTFEPLRFENFMRQRAVGVIVLQAYVLDQLNEPMASAVTCDWYEDQGQIVIKYISGLSDSTFYKIRVLVI